MKQLAIFLLLVSFCGCAFVEYQESERKMHTYFVSDEEITKLNIPTGIPLVYELDEDLKPISHRYLGDPEEIAAAARRVAEQGKAK